MEGFTTALALVDFIPVAAFGVAIILLAQMLGSPLFVIGAVISLVAGLCKVLWKLILGTTKKDVKWLNKGFIPMQSGGWLIMLLAVLINLGSIDFGAVLRGVCAMPQLIFFVLWIALLGAMIWYKKTKFERYSAKANWTAEIINSVGQTCFLIAMLIVK